MTVSHPKKTRIIAEARIKSGRVDPRHSGAAEAGLVAGEPSIPPKELTEL